MLLLFFLSCSMTKLFNRNSGQNKKIYWHFCNKKKIQIIFSNIFQSHSKICSVQKLKVKIESEFLENLFRENVICHEILTNQETVKKKSVVWSDFGKCVWAEKFSPSTHRYIPNPSIYIYIHIETDTKIKVDTFTCALHVKMILQINITFFKINILKQQSDFLSC